MTTKNFLKLLSLRNVFRKNAGTSVCLKEARRHYADTSSTDSSSKQVMVQGTENEERVRVRRARVSDVPRVTRFVRENVRLAFPTFDSTPGTANVVLADYIARALAQGHSMLAEQQERRNGWSQIRGLALSRAVCPWDAAMLERWARCIQCTRSRRLMNFTAHCLRAPALHDKYRVHNILQVILIVPKNTPQTTEIVHMLARNAIQRGREVGFPLIRFDVSNEFLSKSLESLQLRKEWQLSYEILPNMMKDNEYDGDGRNGTTNANKQPAKGNFIAVYTSFTKPSKS